MALKTSFLPHFPHQLQGRPKPSAVSRLTSELSKLQNLALPDIAGIVGSLLPQNFFTTAPDASPQRERIYTPITVLWAFLFQVLNPGMACQEVVGKVRAWILKRPVNPKRPSLDSSSYCEARLALSLPLVKAFGAALVHHLQQRAATTWLWCGRVVKVLDGTSMSMPDTPANQRRWPQPPAQKKGCGFPVVKMLGVFCLSTGGWLGYALSRWNRHDLGLWRKVAHLLKKDDVLVGDAGFCAWTLMAELSTRGVDCVFRLHQQRSKDMRRGTPLAKHDRLQTWRKPAHRHKGSPWPKRAWNKLPAQIAVRVVKVPIERKGFRTTCLWLATTLTDANRYSREALAELYYRRWSIELFFRDLKTTMHMDVLRTKSPAMIEKEIAMHAAAYNAIRALILNSAIVHQQELGRISFKGALDLVRQWLPRAAAWHDAPRKLRDWLDELLTAIAQVQNPHRPGRREPRAKKRRPKSHQLLTKPRHEFQEIPHRETYRRSNDQAA
jgi:Transposase DDE domain